MSLFTPAATLLRQDGSDNAASVDAALHGAFETKQDAPGATPAPAAPRPSLRLVPSAAPDVMGPGAADAPDPGPESVVLRRAEPPTPIDTAARELRAARRVEAEQDRLLVERARQGDERAFAALVSRHQRRAEIVAHRLLRDREEARDLVQDAFLRVYKGLDSFHGRSSFFTWLYRILSNLAIDRSRRPAHRRLEYTDQADLGEGAEAPFRANLDGDPEAHVRCVELTTVLDAALNTLPSYHRDVIIMRELRGMSYEEMAQSMSVSKGTIMSRLFHARKKLHRELERHEL